MHSIRVVKELLVAERLHQLLKGGALGAVGWKVWKAGLAAEVAVEVAAEFDAAGTEDFFGEVGGFDDADLLLVGQRLVVILPCGEDFVAGLWRACREGGRDAGCTSAERRRACPRCRRRVIWKPTILVRVRRAGSGGGSAIAVAVPVRLLVEISVACAWLAADFVIRVVTAVKVEVTVTSCLIAAVRGSSRMRRIGGSWVRLLRRACR